MTSPHRGTGAQQVTAAAELKIPIKVRAGLTIKKGKINVKPAPVRTITGHAPPVKEILQDREQAASKPAKILNPDRQGTEKAITSGQEQAVTGNAVPSGRKAREAQAAPQTLNRVHLKKAALKRCREMKTAVILKKIISVPTGKDRSGLFLIRNQPQEVQTAGHSAKGRMENHSQARQDHIIKILRPLHQ